MLSVFGGSGYLDGGTGRGAGPIVGKTSLEPVNTSLCLKIYVAGKARVGDYRVRLWRGSLIPCVSLAGQGGWRWRFHRKLLSSSLKSFHTSCSTRSRCPHHCVWCGVPCSKRSPNFCCRPHCPTPTTTLRYAPPELNQRHTHEDLKLPRANIREKCKGTDQDCRT